MLTNGVDYHDLGAHYLDRRDKAKVANRLTRRLRDLGYKVQIEEPAA